MVSISLCMIVKNEESCLRQCLTSISDLVDELKIVDTGSTDTTISIIKEFTNDVPHFEWINDFSAARNYAFSLATKQYILWLDADDILKEEDRIKFKNLKENLSDSIDIVNMPYDISFNEQGEVTLSVPRKRLIKNFKGFHWRYFVHEELLAFGNTLDTDIRITHTSDHSSYSRYLKNYELRLANGYELLPHERYFYGAELFMSQRYQECYDALNAITDDSTLNLYEKSHRFSYLSEVCLKLGKVEQSIDYLLKTFVYQPPDSYSCYRLGDLFYKIGHLDNALFWYQLPLKESKAEPELRFNCCLQLCIVHYQLHDTQKAVFYNEEAGKLFPNHPSVQYNRTFFTANKNKDNTDR